MQLGSFKARFIILSIIVCISGFSQGLLLPLISFIFEDRGISASLSGLHTTGLYIGVFLSSLIIEGPMRKYGYRFLIIVGGITVSLAILTFPILDTVLIWFILRLIIGIADNVLHISTQTWLTQTTPIEKIGRVIAVYGLFFSFGFMVGPKVSELVVIWEPLPFVVSGVLTMLAWPLILLIKDAKDAKPDPTDAPMTFFTTLKNFKAVFITSWATFMFPMLYGFFEASINSNFPVFALRNGLEISAVTWILPMFNLGGILLQLPIGALGDRIGRDKLLTGLLVFGIISFTLMEVFNQSFIGLILLFTVSGMATGSVFSLGLGYMADVTPRENLPAGNVMANIMFSIGSIVGPIIGGFVISVTDGAFYFTFFVFIMTIILVLNLVYMSKRRNRMTQ
ncbi:MFS transporter [Phocicoccus pinnipedialis]|uniref:Putative MFS-type transporter YcaD n=1 Tax=Phocicoccus pinnipedialis TaxID=110845 RepID=A0A6V7RAK7_9BACL|nr:MFS transporter [Jeotgalicoccus pinnipedialis]MBP1940202.1 MFS family permease [Jeotgalicoccus pinnipedialis]CAD2073994.1 putative MFS-type transporter YcaD [Jeotgalicoccus pinnipedialis]